MELYPKPRLKQKVISKQINARQSVLKGRPGSMEDESVKTFLKNKTYSKVRFTPEEECPLCQRRIRLKNLPGFIQRALFSKYSNSIKFFYTKGVNEILNKHRSRALSLYNEDQYWLPSQDCIVSYVRLQDYRERFKNLWKYHQFNIDQPKQDYKNIFEIAESYFHSKRRLQEKAIKKMLDVMTDSELEECEIKLSRFLNHREEFIEGEYKGGDRVIPKGMQTKRKQSLPSLSIIECIANQGQKKSKGSRNSPKLSQTAGRYMILEYGRPETPWEMDHFFGNATLLEETTKEHQWPSFVESTDIRKLEELNQPVAPKPYFGIDRYFTKKNYKQSFNTAANSSKINSIRNNLKEGSLVAQKSLGSSNRLFSGSQAYLRSKERQSTFGSQEKSMKVLIQEGDEQNTATKMIKQESAYTSGKKTLNHKDFSSKFNTKFSSTFLTATKKIKPKDSPVQETNHDLRRLVRELKSGYTASQTSQSPERPVAFKYVPDEPQTERAALRAGTLSRSRSTKRVDNALEKLNCKIVQIVESQRKKLEVENNKPVQKLPFRQVSRDVKYQSTANLKLPSRTLESASAAVLPRASLLAAKPKNDQSLKRLKQRPTASKPTSISKSRDVLGYDPQITGLLISPRDNGMSASRTSKHTAIWQNKESEKLNIYSSNLIHNFISNKRPALAADGSLSVNPHGVASRTDLTERDRFGSSKALHDRSNGRRVEESNSGQLSERQHNFSNSRNHIYKSTKTLGRSNLQSPPVSPRFQPSTLKPFR